MKYILFKKSKWLLLVLLTSGIVSCASYTPENVENEGGIVGSGNAIDCDLQPDNEMCRKHNVQPD